MSAQLDSMQGRDVEFGPMRREHLESVIAIENSVYAFPWTLRNFSDSLDAGYTGCVLHVNGGARPRFGSAVAQSGEELAGYFVLMFALDESHLLNLSVAEPYQHHGYGRQMLDHAAAMSRREGANSMLLEVRVSNRRAIDIYRRFGFSPIGLRKGYYPQSAADGNSREDAQVMRLVL